MQVLGGARREEWGDPEEEERRERERENLHLYVENHMIDEERRLGKLSKVRKCVGSFPVSNLPARDDGSTQKSVRGAGDLQRGSPPHTVHGLGPAPFVCIKP